MTGNYWEFHIPYLAKVGVGGSNPLARSKSLNDLDHLGRSREARLSAECPRNTFPGGSDQEALPTRDTSEAGTQSRDGRPSGDRTTKTGVRHGSLRPGSHRHRMASSTMPSRRSMMRISASAPRSPANSIPPRYLTVAIPKRRPAWSSRCCPSPSSLWSIWP